MLTLSPMGLIGRRQKAIVTRSAAQGIKKMEPLSYWFHMLTNWYGDSPEFANRQKSLSLWKLHLNDFRDETV